MCLIKYALQFNVKLGFENRYHYMDIPIIDEMEELLCLADPGQLGFIYDVGHAQALDRLGFFPHSEWLTRYSARIFGTHLHDVIGVSDHFAPGLGEIDFKKRQSIFIKLIHDQAAFTLEGMEALKAYMSEDTSAAARLTTTEKQADEARRILIAELNKTFITPFDREDIFSLSRTIDDVLDYAYSTVTEMEVLKVRPTPFMLRIASILRDAAYELLMAVDRLELHAEGANENAQRAKSLENRGEGVS